MKKRIALILASAMLVSTAVCSLASCNGDSGKKGHVYYLNFKPEIDAEWQALAAKYTEETGIQVDVSTAASGTYEQTLTSEIAKTDAPTLFQINGPVGYANWKDYCYDLTDTDLYKELTTDDFAVKDSDGKVRAVAYAVECYGIIVNTELLEKSGHQLSEITNFETLKAVAEDITAHSKDLGFSAFTNASLAAGEDWRMQTHLANIPLFYEFRDDNVDTTKTPATIKGTYLDNYRQIFDLYLNNATCAPSLMTSKSVDDATAEFAAGQAVFFQNGDWAYNQIKDLGDDKLAMIPIYIGVEGEENQGIAAGTENYWAVNSQAAEEDIQATLDFLKWVTTTEEGTTALASDMSLASPFKQAKAPANVLDKFNQESMAAGKYVVSWAPFKVMPSEDYKTELGSYLSAYAAKPTDANWNRVKEAFVDNWAAEVEKTAQASTEAAE